MDVKNFVMFFEKVAEAGKGRWLGGHVGTLAAFTVPPKVYGLREELLKADIALAHAKWFLDGLVDPAPFVQEDRGHTFAMLADRVRNSVQSILVDVPADEVEQVWRALSLLAWDDICGRRLSERARWSKGLRVELWDSVPEPHCYLCGFRFTKIAKDRFLAGGGVDPPLPALTDFVRARVSPRHVRVEVDHVFPLVDGGSNDVDNLRLTCGWCNVVKGRYGSLYDARPWSTLRFQHPGLGWLTLPRPLWTLRIASFRGRCEHVECRATLRDGELLVAPWCDSGALTPANMKIYCAVHDPWKANRLVDRSLLTRS